MQNFCQKLEKEILQASNQLHLVHSQLWDSVTPFQLAGYQVC